MRAARAIKAAWRRAPEPRLALWGGLGHLLWEASHSPLYDDWGRDWDHLVWTRLHCTAGDVIILLAAFWATSALYRSRDWIDQERSGPTLVFVSLGIAYTACSEWINVTVRDAWGYGPAMPTIGYLGLSPLLQWFVVPVVAMELSLASGRRRRQESPSVEDR